MATTLMEGDYDFLPSREKRVLLPRDLAQKWSCGEWSIVDKGIMDLYQMYQDLSCFAGGFVSDALQKGNRDDYKIDPLQRMVTIYTKRESPKREMLKIYDSSVGWSIGRASIVPCELVILVRRDDELYNTFWNDFENTVRKTDKWRDFNICQF